MCPVALGFMAQMYVSLDLRFMANVCVPWS